MSGELISVGGIDIGRSFKMPGLDCGQGIGHVERIVADSETGNRLVQVRLGKEPERHVEFLAVRTQVVSLRTVRIFHPQTPLIRLW